MMNDDVQQQQQQLHQQQQQQQHERQHQHIQLLQHHEWARELSIAIKTAKDIPSMADTLTRISRLPTTSVGMDKRILLANEGVLYELLDRLYELHVVAVDNDETCKVANTVGSLLCSPYVAGLLMDDDEHQRKKQLYMILLTTLEKERTNAYARSDAAFTLGWLVNADSTLNNLSLNALRCLINDLETIIQSSLNASNHNELAGKRRSEAEDNLWAFGLVLLHNILVHQCAAAEGWITALIDVGLIRLLLFSMSAMLCTIQPSHEQIENTGLVMKMLLTLSCAEAYNIRQCLLSNDLPSMKLGVQLSRHEGAGDDVRRGAELFVSNLLVHHKNAIEECNDDA